MLSLNQWTTKRWSLPEAVEGCVRHGIGGICSTGHHACRRYGDHGGQLPAAAVRIERAD